MLSAVIPTLDCAGDAAALVPALVASRAVDEVIVADGGSTDGTPVTAAEAGAIVVGSERGRGPQLAAGAAAARGDWLLFLHADSVLEPGWEAAVAPFMADETNCGRAAYFRLRFDDAHRGLRRLARIVAWRSRTLGLPYGDQGLLIHRSLYDALGGYRPIPIMEDVDLVRRLGRGKLVALKADIITSARRYRRGGWWLRSARNLFCLGLYFCRVPPRLIARIYG